MRIKNKFIYLLFTFFCITSPVYGQTVIQMEKDGGVYKIPCEINGLRLKLIFDTGASSICISESIAVMMLENGYLDSGDIVGSGSSVVADGRIVDNTIINIKTLKIGDVTLSDVQAVVIHQQSAPLLLGQSAIQKLGKVSIEGNKLILNQYSSSSRGAASRNLLPAEVDEYCYMAVDACSNGLYELAVSYFDILYNQGYLNDTILKIWYADSLRRLEQYNKAIKIYKEVESDLVNCDPHYTIQVYSDLQMCYYYIEEYTLSILSGQVVLQKIGYSDIKDRYLCLWWIVSSYTCQGNVSIARNMLFSELRKYFDYAGVKATDCWDKNYKDEYIAKLYTYLSTLYESNDDAIKYMIIAAAWGGETAIEFAHRYSIPYNVKPQIYVY